MLTSPLNIELRLQTGDEKPYLVYKGGESPSRTTPSAKERIVGALQDHDGQISGESLRSACGMKSSTFWQALNQLVSQKVVTKAENNSYLLLPSPAT